jgi:glycosyltransferase involved in cell wall biosynthesis
VARHTGIQAATSKWVAFLDSDDYWEHDHLERMERAIIATKGQARFYFSDVMTHSPGRRESYWVRRRFAISGKFEFRPDATEWVMWRGQPMLLQASVFNRDAYFASGGFWAPLRNREDTHMFYKLGLGGPACAVAGIGAHMTADDMPENRLTLTMAKQPNQAHIYNVMIFNELLKRDITPASRRELRFRLAMTHYRLARLYMRSHEWKKAIFHLKHSLQINPRASQQAVLEKITGFMSTTVQQEQ